MRMKSLSLVLALGFALVLPDSPAMAAVEGVPADIPPTYYQNKRQTRQLDADTHTELSPRYTSYGCASGGHPGQTVGGNPNSPCSQRTGAPTPVYAGLEPDPSVKLAGLDDFNAAPGQAQYFVRSTSQGIMACAIKATGASDMDRLKIDAVYNPDAAQEAPVPIAFYGSLENRKPFTQELLQPVATPPILGQLPQMFQMLTGGQQGIMMNLCNIIPNRGACQAAMAGPTAAGAAAFGNLAMTAMTANLFGGQGTIRHPTRAPQDRTPAPRRDRDPPEKAECSPGVWRESCQTVSY
jgi:hypothetical protein